jgi:hypothetical protein
MQTNRELLRNWGFTDQAEDSLQRAIIKRLKTRKGALTNNELLFLSAIIGHEAIKHASK